MRTSAASGAGSPAGAGSATPDPPARWAWIAALYGLGYLVGLSFLEPTDPRRPVIELVAFLPFSIGTAAAFATAAHRGQGSAFTRGFAWYATSFALTAIGTTLSVGYLIAGSDPTYGWPNLPFLLSYPAAFAAVLTFRAGRPDPAERWKLAADCGIAVIVAVALTWLYVVEPLAAFPQSPGQRILVFAYPVGDLVLFAALVPMLLGSRPPRAATVLGWVATAQMLYLVADLAYQLPERPQLGLPVDWADLLYIAGYVTFIAAAERYWRHPVLEATTDQSTDRVPFRNRLPLLLGLGLYALLLAKAFTPWHLPHSTLAVAAVAVTALILIREAITERQRLRLARQAEVDRGNRRLHQALDHLDVGVLIHDGQGRLHHANDAARRLLGASGAEFGNRPADGAFDAIRDDGTALPRDHHPVLVALRTGQPVNDQLVGISRGDPNDRTWLLVNASPVPSASGAVEEVVTSLHDVTERRQFEAQLRQAQRMEAVGQLAGGVAHDFNNLLTAILGYTSLLEGDLPENDRRRHDASEIRRAAERASDLTRQLLAFGRRQLLRAGVLDANEVISGTQSLLRRLIPETIEIRVDLAPDAGTILADRGQIEQVVVNLAVNARDAMPKGGRLTITTRPDRTDDGPVVLIRVDDDGVGMDESTRSRAFEPFFTTKEVGAGTGLGLATVYGIVRQSGGDVALVSAPGRGTTVTVSLPRHGPPPPTPALDRNP
ncbi:MAG: ATP-binding protein [Gemmatimonadales bacterium]|nr:ATP-binding protein [Gemmatimonadales bacterium]